MLRPFTEGLSLAVNGVPVRTAADFARVVAQAKAAGRPQVLLLVLGFALAVLFLLKRRREESGGSWGPAFLDRVPGVDRLDKFTYSAHIIGFPLWTFTLIAGAIWAREAWGAYWNWDPKEVWTFVIWTVYAAYLHARATKNTPRRTANWIAIAGFVCIVINYTVVNFYFIGQHSYAQ